MIGKDLQSLERARDPLRKARVEMKTGEGNSRMVKGFLKMVWLGRKPMFIQQMGLAGSCVKDLFRNHLIRHGMYGAV